MVREEIEMAIKISMMGKKADEIRAIVNLKENAELYLIHNYFAVLGMLQFMVL